MIFGEPIEVKEAHKSTPGMQDSLQQSEMGHGEPPLAIPAVEMQENELEERKGDDYFSEQVLKPNAYVGGNAKGL